MSYCLHYDRKAKECSLPKKECKFQNTGNLCSKNGKIEEKSDNFRLIPVDRISPWWGLQ